MTSPRDRHRRLEALEAQAEHIAPAGDAPAYDGPDWWAGCLLCGNVSDPRDWPEVAPGERVCPFCGGGHPPAPRWACVACGDEHAPAQRTPSEWNRFGACPVCGYTPPPVACVDPSGQRFEAWYLWIDETFCDGDRSAGPEVRTC